MTALPPASRVIVTADDFGMDGACNDAIVHALANGWVSHASLLVNLGFADEACARAIDAGAEKRIGLHLNFSEGEPLTPGLKDLPGFCRNGQFRPVEEFPRYRRLSAAERRAVAAEVSAQVDALSTRGIQASHLDSHNDVHTAPSIAAIVVQIVRQRGISRMRISRNCGVRQGVLRRVHHRAYNVWLTGRGLRVADYYGSVDDMVWLGRRGDLKPDTVVEVMTHPRKSADAEVIDVPSMELLVQRLKRLRPYLPVSA